MILKTVQEMSSVEFSKYNNINTSFMVFLKENFFKFHTSVVFYEEHNVGIQLKV